MVLGYLTCIFLPVVLSGYIFYTQFHTNIMANYIQGQQNLIVQASNSLKVGLTQVESIYSLFQYNTQVIEYLNGYYSSDLDYIYHFRKDIRPVFSLAQAGNPSIQSIRLYKLKDKVMEIPGEIDHPDDLRKNQVRPMLDRLRVNQGIWLPGEEADNEVPSITYYQNIYNSTYTVRLAILELVVDNTNINDFLKAVNVNDHSDAAIAYHDKLIYQSAGFQHYPQQVIQNMERLNADNKDYLFMDKEGVLINSIEIPDLNLDFYFFSSTEPMIEEISGKTLRLGLLMLGMLIVLSTIYYFFASTLTKRILKLARHMRKVDENKLTVYEEETNGDEIGYLAVSYNSLIRRIDELLNKVHRAELVKKEAEYLVLQAQIKPHFLYNTLETIRMLAEINDDEEVVEATYTFGKLLRYSLSSAGNETSLIEEIGNIRHYLEIQKLRMMDRLSFEINIRANIDKLMCPRFILQPLIENSIHHGLSKMRRPGWIKVDIEEQPPYLRITIADNGAGIPRDRLATIHGVLNHTLDKSLLQTKNSGFGLYNVSERIELFFGEGSRLDIESREGEGTAYILMLKV